ncbi:MAG: GNAT family N-acetyltransferase [Panacibacter sp.]
MSSQVENTEYHIARLSEENIGDVEQLHVAVYKKQPAKDHFKKKYNTTYTGVSNIGYLAYNNNGIPIAFYGVIPCFIKNENNILLAAQSADTMTHPDYRLKGMFVELSNLCFELCRTNKIKLVFGFPNQNFYQAAINKPGWKFTEIMDRFTISVKTVKLKSIFSKFVITRKIYHKYEILVLKKYMANDSGVENSVIKDGYAGVYRNKDYLAYKSYSSTQVIKIGASKIWIKVSTNITVGDIELNENNIDEILLTIKKIAASLRMPVIYFHACKQTTLHQLFAERFAATPSFPVLFQDFGSELSPEKIKFTFADIDIF